MNKKDSQRLIVNMQANDMSSELGAWDIISHAPSSLLLLLACISYAVMMIDNLWFYCPFRGTTVISRRWKGGKESLCLREPQELEVRSGEHATGFKLHI